MTDSAALDIGDSKQLFLDEGIIDSLENLHVQHHSARPTGEVLVRPDDPEELLWRSQIGAYCSVLKVEGRLRLWYFSQTEDDDRSRRRVRYAESEDGIHFSRSRDNAVVDEPVQGACVWVDPNAAPEQRYRSQAKWGPFPGDSDTTLVFFASPNGFDWRETHRVNIGECDTQNVVFWDESVRRYLMYTRQWVRNEDRNLNYRQVRRIESDDLVHWGDGHLVFEADEAELAMHNTPTGQACVDYYGALVFRYPRAGDFYVMVTQPFWHWLRRAEADRWGPSPDPGAEGARIERLGPSIIDARLAYSRDGVAFCRPADRRAFVGTGPSGGFDSRRVWVLPQPVFMEDEIWFYYAGSNKDHCGFVDSEARGHETGIGRAVLRLDGFASIDAGSAPGVVTTKPLRFSGTTLNLNLETGGGGYCKVEILDSEGNAFPGFGAAEAVPLWGNSVGNSVRWSGEPALEKLHGRIVRLRFHLLDAAVYSFQFAGAPS